MFYSIRHLLTDQLKKQLYYSLVHSRILYGIELYAACSDSLLNRVQTIQNKLLKVLYDLTYRTNTNELHSKLGLLKVKDIYHFQVLKFVYESVNKIAIVQFHNYYRYQNTVHHHNTRNENKLYAMRARTKYGQSTLNFLGTKLWNSLDINIQNSKSTYIFKKTIKQKFITTYNE